MKDFDKIDCTKDISFRFSHSSSINGGKVVMNLLKKPGDSPKVIQHRES